MYLSESQNAGNQNKTLHIYYTSQLTKSLHINYFHQFSGKAKTKEIR